MKNGSGPKKIFFAINLFLFFLFSSSGDNYPVITEIKSQNIIFAQYQQEVEEANMAMARGKNPYLNLYSYVAKKDETMFTVSARCSIRYDTLATANGIDSTQTSLEGKKLVLPTVNGIFVPHTPQTQIEILLAKEHSVDILAGKYPTVYINERPYYFLQNLSFSHTERTYFLNTGMFLPLKKSVLTSEFGMRISPISGQWKKHNGIDMAAPLGTAVYSCKSGIVQTVGVMDAVYGNYIIIDHGSGMTSLYAHLKDTLVKKGERVSGGQNIGHVGLTGATTGPHLHFEIRLNGTAKDPQQYLK